MANAGHGGAADKLNSQPNSSRAQHAEELDIRAPFAFAIPVFDQLTILAPGLLGGSVAKAAHTRGLARHIVIWARRPEVRQQLREQPWCNQIADTAEAA